MPRGNLDDTHELYEPDEGLRANTAAGDWFAGTSRDLLSTAEDTRAEFADVAKPPAGDATDSPLHAGTVAALDAPRNDGRDDALRDFQLDAISKSVAQEIGRELAHSIGPDRWERMPIQERSTLCEIAYETIADRLEINAAAPVADSTLAKKGLDGYSDANSVHYNAEQLVDDSPQRVLETLAHEYRHIWEVEVISGNLEHPLGAAGREWLQEGWSRYNADANDFDDYAWNPLELDAESFARLVFNAYYGHPR
jgi:hypothetical protein